MSPDIRRNAFIAWLLIIIQFITPVLTLLPAPVRADVDMSADMQGTIHGLNSLIFGEPAGHHDSPPVVSGEGQTVAPVVPLSAGPQGQRAVPDARLIPEPRVSPGLPDLTRPVLGQGRPLKVPSENMLERHVAERSSEPEGTLASGAMQMGSMFSSENRTDAAINYARGVGEGLINQRVNDWLNQFGNAKVSLGSDGQFSGDMLIPLHDTDQNLIFTQLGVRRGQERNTVNLGAGYRTYMDDWMLGGNVFYDYDYTGKNRRLGGGAELWRDYLKLGVNGYIRLTNWHQSVLSEMEDYDERPANGFDIRAEGYLPAWPYLGGSLKYEQYFGRGVSVSDSTSPDTLKDNPAVLTAGLSYTPFPLMTLSASRSVGDSNDTRMALDINYRLGVPWYQQVSPDNVDLMRSLAGNKYDFVDRNYNIVMQYRKQELLRIGLPERRRAQAMETITIPLTISKVKYGLKGVDWSVSPELVARGGRYRILTPTEIEVMLPAYIFSGDQKTPQTYQISAMATDNHDNQSNTATMQIDVVPSDNGVTIKSDKNNAKADGQGTDSVLVQVTDKKAGQVVALTADNGAVIAKTVTTDEKGQATASLTSMVAGASTVTATMLNGNYDTTEVHFVADSATAQVKSVLLQGDEVSRVADGSSSFRYAVTVTDANGNPVADQTVTAQADKPDHVTVAADGATNAAGQTTVTLTSTTTAVSDIQVSVRAGSTGRMVDADKKVSFVAGAVSPDKSDFVAAPDHIVADGQAVSTLTLTLRDSNGNAVSGQAATLSAKVAGAGDTQVTGFTEGTAGSYTAGLTGTEAGQATVQAMQGARPASNDKPAVTLTADAGTAQVSALAVTQDGAKADGEDADSVQVQVTDAHDNPVAGQAVALTADNGAVIAKTVTTDEKGRATAPLTSKVAGLSTVTATLGDSSQTATAHFVADGATAQVKSVLLQGDEVSRVADGSSSFRYAVTVTDANGNPVADQTVTAQADKPDHVTVAADGATNAAGQTTVTLTSTTTAVSDIQVSVRAGSTGTMVDADKKVSFVADVSIKDIAVNGYIFGKDEGFPTTGFKGAMFTIELKNGNASDFNWKADAPWVTVKDGVVSFNDIGTGSKVTITGTPISGEGKIISWDFTLKNWFINNGTTTGTDMDEASFCGSNFSKVPTIQQLNGSERSDGKRGTLGGLWSEWGNLTAFNGSGFVSTNPITDYTGYWTSQYAAATYIVSLSNGKLGTIIGNFSEFMVCRKSM
ncbi:inverse autotransporter beta domain-containing protein [Citrobacter europaeus]|uniref:inverse autotransporter beta domain-containing protein n=2 Tax=Citrobacter europaeus TaxID=1914243 RepID=UPI00388FB3BC